jgi:hypothetical protein
VEGQPVLGEDLNRSEKGTVNRAGFRDSVLRRAGPTGLRDDRPRAMATSRLEGDEGHVDAAGAEVGRFTDDEPPGWLVRPALELGRRNQQDRGDHRCGQSEQRHVRHQWSIFRRWVERRAPAEEHSRKFDGGRATATATMTVGLTTSR